jgi:MerR family transcriptional regulator, light-induced transcriptional regulator
MTLAADVRIQISEVSRMLGIPVPTIRSWERRYGFPSPDRTDGKHRRYSRDEVELLRELRDEITRGHPASEAVGIVADRRAHTGTPRAGYVAAFLDAAMALDPMAMRRTLDEATEALGVDSAVGDVALPAMREIGTRWSAGTCDVPHEHLATDSVRTWLARLTSTGPVPKRGTLVLACGPKDLHAIGLEAFGVLLAERGWGVRMLGPLTPSAAVVRAVVETRALGAVVVSQRGVTRRAAIETIVSVARLANAEAFYAGDAFAAASARRDVPGVYLGTDLIDAAGAIERALEDRATGHVADPQRRAV